MAKMRWDTVPKPVIPLPVAGVFCRCGKRFVPVRRFHRLCPTCAARKFG